MSERELRDLTALGWLVLAVTSAAGWFVTFVFVRRLYWLIRTTL